jgi:hypothetical protein
VQTHETNARLAELRNVAFAVGNGHGRLLSLQQAKAAMSHHAVVE